MINEYDTKGLRVNNFESHHKAIESLSIVDIVRIVDYVNELSTFIPSENEVLDYLEDIVEPFGNITNELRTEAECPHCGCYLFKSDLPQYDYVCAECDENFYECEVK
ncbi:MAG: hypothetical protein UHD64_00255 [Bacteroidales bacterium]|nr:hypothetical protein [Bacteroidales bacterium]